MPAASKDNLKVPYPNWAKDGGVDGGDRDFENWKELQRWADRFLRGEALIFHWPTAIADHIDVRNGPGKFDYAGPIYEIEYEFDVEPASGVTVEWYFDDDPANPVWTHVVTGDGIKNESTQYRDQKIVGIVTVADSTASGMTVKIRTA